MPRRCSPIDSAARPGVAPRSVRVRRVTGCAGWPSRRRRLQAAYSCRPAPATSPASATAPNFQASCLPFTRGFRPRRLSRSVALVDWRLLPGRPGLQSSRNSSILRTRLSKTKSKAMSDQNHDAYLRRQRILKKRWASCRPRCPPTFHGDGQAPTLYSRWARWPRRSRPAKSASTRSAASRSGPDTNAMPSCARWPQCGQDLALATPTVSMLKSKSTLDL
jgi:hypothetical protein